MNSDAKGVIRGRCSVCTACTGYDGGEKRLKCVNCAHPPTKHANLSAGATSPEAPSFPQQQSQVVRDQLVTAAPTVRPKTSPQASSKPQRQTSPHQPPSSDPEDVTERPRFSSPRQQCQIQGCDRNVFVDLNEGKRYSFCRKHVNDFPAQTSNLRISSDTDDYMGDGYDVSVDSSVPPAQAFLSHSTHPTASLPPSVERGRPVPFRPPAREMISNAIERVSSFGDWESPRGVCRQCHARVPPERKFCSVECSDQCWREYRNYQRRAPVATHQAPPDLDMDAKSEDPQPNWFSSLWGPGASLFSPRTRRPRTACDGPPTPAPYHQPPGAGSPNPMASSQSTPVLTPPLVPSQPSVAPAPQPPVPPDQQCKLPGCTRRKYVEPRGRVHDFCGRTHSRNFMEQGVPPHLRCNTQGCMRQKRQKDDGSGYFDFCGLTCRNGGLEASASMPNFGTTEEDTCKLPECRMAKYTDPANGRVHDYCCRTHASEATRKGIVTDTVTITALKGKEFQTVSAKFTRTWAPKKGNCPTLVFVFEVKNAKLRQRWQSYQKTLTNQSMEEHYHGTKLTCQITTTQVPCTDQDCGICGISSGGLDRRCIQKNIKYQRFGHGFYLAPNSSKCHDYTQGAHTYRAMLLCEVFPGNKYNLKQGDQRLKGPPQGYDSVHGQSGADLNYDELVVYNPDCVMPRYVCVYQKDGADKIAK